MEYLSPLSAHNPLSPILLARHYGHHSVEITTEAEAEAVGKVAPPKGCDGSSPKTGSVNNTTLRSNYGIPQYRYNILKEALQVLPIRAVVSRLTVLN